MSGRGRGRGWYYKQKYGGGGGRGGGNGSGGYERNKGHGGTGHWQPDEADDMQQGAGPSTALEEEEDAAPAYLTQLRQMGNAQQLRQDLLRIDGKGYKAYHDIQGSWAFQGFTLLVDHVQGDPYASPSRLRVQLPATSAGYPPELWQQGGRVRRVALCDWLARRLAAQANTATADARTQAAGWHGAKGGDVLVDRPGQHVLERTAVLLLPDGGIEARFTLGLPAQGRSVMGQWAARILVDDLPRHVQAALPYGSQDTAALWRHVKCVEDTQALRDSLPSLNLVAFVGDGSILPRASGASDAPMPAAQAVAFRAPDSLAVEVQLPHAGRVRGLGVKKGITLIVGGGFHGKSTLLEAIEAGVYNKVPDDGRELVATDPGAVKVRAEDGRRIAGVDITPFIDNLPYDRTTSSFQTDDASGSTSQAAAIQEALEVNSTCLLLDEDTCATNLMIRDARMMALVAADKEPITPFLAKVGALRLNGVSTILVMGGSGVYFDVADTVISMDAFVPHDATARAKQIAAQFGTPAAVAGMAEGANGYGRVAQRVPTRVYTQLHGAGGRPVKCQARGLHLIQYGDQDIQLAALEQLVDKSQTRAIGDAIKWLHGRVAAGGGAQRSLMALLQELDAAIEQQGLDVLSPHWLVGNLARPRIHEMAAAINRLRTLQVSQHP